MSPTRSCAPRFLLVLAALLWSAGCGGGDGAGTTPSSTPTSTTAVDGGVTVLSDVRYADDGDGRLPALLDVYTPDDAAGLPVVVLLHGGGLDKNTQQYTEIARQLAARGVVVVAPNWGPAGGLPSTTDTVAAANADNDLVACAVSYVVANGEQWGADPTRIVLFGHSAGANAASVVMFSYTRATGAGCAVSPQQWQPQAVVLWDGELGLLDEGLWSNYADVLPELFRTITPWSQIAPAIYGGPVHLLVTASFRNVATNCNVLAGWADARDPSGAYRAALTDVGAADDQCVDIGEVHQALTEVLVAAGLPADYAELSAAGSTHTELADADLTRLVDLLATWAAGTVSHLE